MAYRTFFIKLFFKDFVFFGFWWHQQQQCLHRFLILSTPNFDHCLRLITKWYAINFHSSSSSCHTNYLVHFHVGLIWADGYLIKKLQHVLICSLVFMVLIYSYLFHLLLTTTLDTPFNVYLTLFFFTASSVKWLKI